MLKMENFIVWIPFIPRAITSVASLMNSVNVILNRMWNRFTRFFRNLLEIRLKRKSAINSESRSSYATINSRMPNPKTLLK